MATNTGDRLGTASDSRTAKAIKETLESSRNGSTANLVDGLFAIAHALQRLGTGDAATPMGAIELLAKSIHDGSESIAMSLDSLAHAIRDTGGRGVSDEEIASAIEAYKDNQE